jgi:hypothetical protein
MGLSFIVAASPRKRSHFRFRVPRDWWPYFSVSDSRLPQPGAPSPRNRVAHLTPRQWVLFFSPPTLAKLRWKYSNPPPHGYFHWVVPVFFKVTPRHGPRRKYPRLHCCSLLQLPSNGLYNTVSNSNSLVVEACLPRRWIATAVVSLFVSRSFPSNVSVRHNMYKSVGVCETVKLCVFRSCMSVSQGDWWYWEVWTTLLCMGHYTFIKSCFINIFNITVSSILLTPVLTTVNWDRKVKTSRPLCDLSWDAGEIDVSRGNSSSLSRRIADGKPTSRPTFHCAAQKHQFCHPALQPMLQW